MNPATTATEARPVLLVTGATKGIGLATALAALDAGYRVAATSRDADGLRAAVTSALSARGDDAAALAGPDRFLPLTLSFAPDAVAASARAVAEAVVEQWGRIDVLVNNAGYAVLGAFEDMDLEQVRANFDVNVFGVLAMTQAVLPVMRRQGESAAYSLAPVGGGAGRVISIASISGTVTGPSQSIYSATKAGVIMMSEALADEVGHLGIQATAVCPSGVRTDFLDPRSMQHAGTAGEGQPAAAATGREGAGNDVVAATMEGLARFNHHQSGDPALVGEAILELASMKTMPRRLYLGAPALSALQGKLNEVAQEASGYIALSRSIDRAAR